ncbi:MAG: hypothetical protein M1840_000299 [Geoglossum simile]|nr:MAG: hypothetical protein M1840_000299 [Geoglossum simile]
MSPGTMEGTQRQQAANIQLPPVIASPRFADAVSSPSRDEGTASLPPCSVASPHSDESTEYFLQSLRGSDAEGRADGLAKELAGFVEAVKACGPEFAEVFGSEIADENSFMTNMTEQESGEEWVAEEVGGVMTVINREGQDGPVNADGPYVREADGLSYMQRRIAQVNEDYDDVESEDEAFELTASALSLTTPPRGLEGHPGRRRLLTSAGPRPTLGGLDLGSEVLREIGDAVLTYTDWNKVAIKVNIGWDSHSFEKVAELVFAASIESLAQQEGTG